MTGNLVLELKEAAEMVSAMPPRVSYKGSELQQQVKAREFSGPWGRSTNYCLAMAY